MADIFKPLSPEQIAQTVDHLVLGHLTPDRREELFAAINSPDQQPARCNWPVCDQCEAGQE